MAKAMRTVGALLGLVGLTGMAAIAACSKSSSDGGGPSSVPVTLADRVTVVDGSAADDVTVLSDRLVLPKATHADALSHKAGDVLVGNKASTGASGNKYGFLRKVVSVQDDGNGNAVVMTTHATLMDAIKEGAFQATLQVPTLGLDGPVAQAWKPGSAPALQTKGPSPIKLLDFSGKSLFSSTGNVTLAAGKTLGYSAHATVTTGTLNFTPSFDVGVEIHPDLTDLVGSLTGAHVIATGTLDADLEMDVGLKLDGTATGDDVAAFIAKKVFGTPTATIANYAFDLDTLHVGPIPIPVHANFTATLSCDLRYGGEVGVQVGGKATGSVSAGFKYDKTAGFTPVFDHTESFTQVGPVWTITGDNYLRCQIKPEFDLNLFDMATGQIWATAYAAMEAKASCDASALTGDVSGEAYAGVSAVAHANVDVLGLFTYDKECTLFDLESPHATVSQSLPLGKGATCAPVTSPPPPTSPTDAPPPACFGDGSGGDAGTGGDGGTGGDAGTGGDGATGGDGGRCSSDTPSSTWTCAASKYGDCTCDCNCGDIDIDCKAGDCSACDHDACTSGTPLGSSCTNDSQGGACIKAICENDSYCCDISWSASCIAHLTNGDFGCTNVCGTAP